MNRSGLKRLLTAGRYYFSARTTFLELSIMFTLAWLIFGFDSGLGGSITNEPIGMGIHWSTLLSMTLTVYILMINYHVNGLRSSKDLMIQFRLDLKYVFRWSRKKRAEGKLFYNEIEYYGKRPLMGSFRALILSICVSLISLFAFEIPWTLYYNWFQFGDIFYPLYYYSGPLFGLTRNFITFAAAIYCYILAVYVIPPNTIIRSLKILKHVFKGDQDYSYVTQILNVPNRYRIKHRFKFLGLSFIILGMAAFNVWIYADQDPNMLKNYDNASAIKEDGGQIFPAHALFPQTIYTFYNTSYLEPYTVDNIGSYWIHDDYIHFLNLLTKTLFFIGVGTIFMVHVKSK